MKIFNVERNGYAVVRFARVVKIQLGVNRMEYLPSDNVLRQRGEPDRKERLIIAQKQREATGFMTANEIAEAQRKALGLGLPIPV